MRSSPRILAVLGSLFFVAHGCAAPSAPSTLSDAGAAPGTGGRPGGSGGVIATGGAATAASSGGAAGGAVTAHTGGASGTAGAAAAAGGTTSTGGRAATGGAAGSAGTTSSGGNSASGGSAAGTAGASGVMLDQTGNPLSQIVNTYSSWLSAASGDAAKLAADRTLADNMITWQMPHGGWFKYGKAKYAAPWNGSDPRADWLGANNIELGTIDNGGTVSEVMFLADVYRRSNDAKYQAAARKGLDFILTMQVAAGGFPQVYPARTGATYSNEVTFNDNAMVRVLAMLDLAAKGRAPFTAATFSSDQQAKLSAAVPRAIDYILRSQIVQNGVKTVWCAQHDPVTYAPKGARSYELPSKSGQESVGVIAFLLSQPQTAEIKASVQAAIAWFKSSAVKVADTAYVSRPAGNTDDSYDPIQPRAGSTMWYRFYDLDKDMGFFSGRLPTDDPPGVGKKYDIMQIEPERRYGYQWGGAYGTTLFSYSDRVGY